MPGDRPRHDTAAGTGRPATAAPATGTVDRVVAEFRIHRRGFVDPDGRLLVPRDTLPIDDDTLLALYRQMVFLRALDEKAIALQRTGRMGTYASCLGQEAVGVATGLAMREDDVFVPYYRDQGAQIARGVAPEETLLYWGGDERGNAFRDPRVREDLPNCVPIATQYTHAAGVAAAFRIRGETRCCVVSGGDGSTSRGEFHEALNLAGVWHLPLVFVINNNRWAISVPLAKQTAAATLAQKAVAAGIPGLQVDGNDALAVYLAVHDAAARARAGKGAMLIEAVTWRLGNHTTADDASRYRNEADVQAAWQLEPVARLRRLLATLGLWNDADEAAWNTQCRHDVEATVARYLAFAPQAPTDLLDHHYAHWPETLAAQRNELLARVARHAGGRQ